MRLESEYMKKTKSLCPECMKVIDASIFEEDGKIIIEKNCKDHGEFKDICWSNSDFYKKFERVGNCGEFPENSNTRKHIASQEKLGDKKGCPYDCGLCSNHKTMTLLANMDVTNRCNQSCRVCFANAAVSGHIYEPSMNQIKKMMAVLRNDKPIPCLAIQFAGGEPTMREDFPEIVAMAKDFGFSQIQVATNGIKLASSVEYCRRLQEAGLNTVYLQFDGVNSASYMHARGYNALPAKLGAIENCRRAGLTSIVLVPTLIKGVNDDQIGEILRFASKNLDVIRGVNIQPVSFVGRITKEEREKQRITIPDFFKLIEEQTNGEITGDDFYPVPFVLPISHFVEAWRRRQQVEFTVHPHCGAATYIFVKNGHFVPITRFIDVERLMEFLDSSAKEVNQSKVSRLMTVEKILREVPKFVDKSKVPTGINITKMLIDVLRKGSIGATSEFHRNTLFLGVMHFQDPYNIDLERVQRCGIHYAVPDGRVIPFCAYNTIYRPHIEREYCKEGGAI